MLIHYISDHQVAYFFPVQSTIMEFGALPVSQVNKINFRLPPDPAGNASILSSGKAPSPKIYIGCAKWGRKEWIGKLYPPGTREKDFLKFYGLYYDSIELNATHYKMYDGAQLKAWAAEVNNPVFKFCPKAHRGMCFLKDSPNRKSLTQDFINNIRALGQQLGPVFITHDEKIKWDDPSEKQFFTYLESLPKDILFFIEERWPGFYADKKLHRRYYGKLKELGIGAVITDTAGRQDVLHMQLTIPKTFIRFVGNSLHPSDYTRIELWAKRIKKWINAGIEDIYFFMHMHNEATSPELTKYVVEQFNKICRTDFPPIRLLNEK